MAETAREVLNFPGLDSGEALKRLKQFGENVVATKKKLRPLVAFAAKFKSPLVLILIFASLVSFFIGEKTNAVILVSMILISVVLDFANSYRSEKAVDQLIAQVVTTVNVIRDGRKEEIKLQYVVPGDIVFLSAGDVVPADCLVLESKDFFVNQSVLTGESLPVEKFAAIQSENPTPEISLSNENSIFMGTNVVTGFATVRVIRTGHQTEFGKIADRLSGAEVVTDFDQHIRDFSAFIMRLTFFLVAAVFLVNTLFNNRSLLSAFIFAVAIAIGLTPELLPVILSVSLSRGAMRMSKNGVIVKHLPSIQNFGRMNILCTDKTGTLTENRITVVKYVDSHGETSEEILRVAYLSSYFHTGVPNPLDQAVKDRKAWDLSGVKKIDEIPFDFERRRDSMVVEKEGQQLIITKGAPEEIFPICRSYFHKDKPLNFDKKIEALATKEFSKLSQDGFKVLAVASKEIKSRRESYEKDEEHQMTLIGFLAFLDPPKPTTLEAVKELENLGVEIKILTGDSELLTQKICRDIKLPVKGSVTGAVLEKLSEVELSRLIPHTTIFARVTPEQKEIIITHLKKNGQVVGYLGDGINDTPALRAADVGISVNNGVDIAKETADILLLKKSLHVLKDGVIEGRKTFRNTLKYLLVGLSSNFGNMLSMTIASVLLPFFPMLPTQILLNNFIYDVSQLSLSTDNVDEDELRRPSEWSLKFIREYMLTFGLISSAFDFITFVTLLVVFELPERSFQTGWFIESLATQVFVIYVVRTKKFPFLESRPSAWLFATTFLAVLAAWLIPFLPITSFFHLDPLSLKVSLSIGLIIVAYLAAVQLVKRHFYQKYREGD
ncbi:MAG: magnesium-translocating P-type ATPase [Candidatus Liptonbacteria bacterium]|nr:magnesium-translocating P-type ATPase [Candidatus Liptonbacteria bacterium]